MSNEQLRIHRKTFLLALALVFFVTGCALPGLGPEQVTTMARLAEEGLADTSSVAPQTIPVIAIAPNVGEPGAAINVSGAGWQPKAQITLYLEAQQKNLKHTLTLISATADEQGQFAIAFIYPMDDLFTLVSTVQVTSLTETGQNAAAVNLLGASPPLAASPTLTATLIPTATVTPSTTAQLPAVGYVISNALNVRTGPSISYAVVHTIRRGAALTVLGQNEGGSWLYVQLDDGAEGWIARSFTDYRDAAPIVATPPLPVEILATATPALTPSPWPTPVALSAWRGEYYDNASLSGAPRLVRNDEAIDFHWGGGAPTTSLPADNFSVRWTRSLHFDSGRYRFHSLMDDGMSLYVDDALVINEWHSGNGREVTTDLSLGWGVHQLRVDYFESGGEARAGVWWERISETTDHFPDWKGEYWSNRDLDDEPLLVRNDEEIDFDWEEDAPASGLPSDNFSARWSQRVDFDRGLYRFFARADDGIRVYVDGNRVLDEWHANVGDGVYTVDVLLDGRHRLKVEYYERSSNALVEFWWQRLSEETLTCPTSARYAN